MSDILEGRVYRLQVDTLLITGLRVAFSVAKSTAEEPNTCRISVYNLSEDTRARLSRMRGVPLRLEAGYTGNAALLFQGDTRRTPAGIQHVKAGPDRVTTLECGDGETAYRYARYSGSYAPGTSVTKVAEDMAKALGVGLGNLEETLRAGGFRQGLQSFPAGFAARGRASEELNGLMRSLGLEASIQDGKLQVLKPGEPLKGQAVLLTPETGLRGSPAYNSAEGKEKDGPPTLKVSSLLQPALRPGVQVRVEARTVRGFFKVKAVTHAGDTHGGDWASECTCVAV